MQNRQLIAMAIVEGANFYTPRGSNVPVIFNAEDALKDPLVSQLVDQIKEGEK